MRYNHRTSRRRKTRFRKTKFLLLLAMGALALWLYGVETPQPVPSAQRSAGAGLAGANNSQILVNLPQDDAPHDAITEWWYYNGHLWSESGQAFSFHYVVFLRNTVVPHTAVHVSLTDHQTGQHYQDQRRTGGNPSSESENGFDFRLGEWAMVGHNGDDMLKVMTEDFGLDLNLSEGGATDVSWRYRVIGFWNRR